MLTNPGIRLLNWARKAALMTEDEFTTEWAPLGVAPLGRNPLSAPANILGGNAIVLNNNNIPTVLIKKPLVVQQ
jgi:hypothetical protein